MERGFGGPVWHASVLINGDATAAWAHAEQALQSVGDAGLGEWREATSYTIQLRRRLSIQEQARYAMHLRDIRGSREEADRLNALFAELPLRHVTAIKRAMQTGRSS